MSQSLVREATGDVVLRTDNVAIRFKHEWGGTPCDFFQEPQPAIINPFPGSAASVAWNTGQDPTQASANGLLNNPIHRVGDKPSWQFDYYIRESLFDAAGIYEVSGHAPDFWLSAESNDDAIAPDAHSPDSGWRTKYNPGRFGSLVNNAYCPVVFEPVGNNFSGILCVGDELVSTLTKPWNFRLREYRQGAISFKINVSMKYASPAGIAGFLFRKWMPPYSVQTKDDAYAAAGYHLYINSAGGWSITGQRGGTAQATLAVGNLSRTNGAKLKSDLGVQVEIRTSTTDLGLIQLYVEDALVCTLHEPYPITHPHFALFAQDTNKGIIVFQQRRVWDMSTQFSSRYTALPGGKFSSKVAVQNSAGVSGKQIFYRANLPAMFLNKTTFLAGNRRTSGVTESGSVFDFEGIELIQNYKKFWAGNKELSLGMLAEVTRVAIDGVPSEGAHLLLQQHSFNDEFVIMLNPLPMGIGTMAEKLEMDITWATRV